MSNVVELTRTEREAEKLRRSCYRCANSINLFGVPGCLAGKGWEKCGGKYFRARQGNECGRK